MSKKVKPATDTSPYVHQDEKFKGTLQFKDKIKWTPKQEAFIKLALDKETKIIFVSGAAGTAKTLLAVECALRLIDKKAVSELVYVRSIAECADKSIGSLPGEIEDKMAPFTQPLQDKLGELLTASSVKTLTNEGKVTAMPINFLRGLSWNAKVIIGDEFQSCSPKEIYTFVTRIGEFSKVFILGDPQQIDIRTSGFEDMIAKLDDEESRAHGIHVFRFTEDDIMRSGLCRFLIKKLKPQPLN